LPPTLQQTLAHGPSLSLCVCVQARALAAWLADASASPALRQLDTAANVTEGTARAGWDAAASALAAHRPHLDWTYAARDPVQPPL
jgi:hypothetical protein